MHTPYWHTRIDIDLHNGTTWMWCALLRHKSPILILLINKIIDDTNAITISCCVIPFSRIRTIDNVRITSALILLDII